MLRSRPIKSLEGVTIGIAECEKTISEFVSVSSSQPSAEEVKPDLFVIPLRNLSEQLAVRVCNGNYTYQGFRDFIFNHTARILMNRNRLPLHTVEEPTAQRADAEEQDDKERPIMTLNEMLEDMVAAVNGQQHGRDNGGRFQKNQK